MSQERDRGGDEHGGGVRGARGGAWRRPEGSGRPTKQEVAKRVGARGGHTPSCPLARGGRRQAGSWAGLGQPAGPLGQARLHSDGLHREVSAGGFSSFLSVFVFCNLF